MKTCSRGHKYTGYETCPVCWPGKYVAQLELPKLPAPVSRALSNAGIEHLGQLAQRREAEVAKLHGLGPNALKKLGASLEAAGLNYR